jgi:hypothetical protein
MTTMKQKPTSPQLTFTIVALVVALTATLAFAGCASTGHGGGGASDHSSHQGSCH